MIGALHVTTHAAERYVQRIDPAATRQAAAEKVTALAASARSRPTPRHWMKSVAPQAGLRFLYPAGAGGVCLIVRGSSVVTILTRTLVRPDQRSEPTRAPDRTRPQRRADRGRRPQRRNHRRAVA